MIQGCILISVVFFYAMEIQVLYFVDCIEDELLLDEHLLKDIASNSAL